MPCLGPTISEKYCKYLNSALPKRYIQKLHKNIRHIILMFAAVQLNDMLFFSENLPKVFIQSFDEKQRKELFYKTILKAIFFLNFETCIKILLKTKL